MLSIDRGKKGNEMHKTGVAVLMFFLVMIGTCSFAGENLINHPIDCYKKSRMCRDCPYDSTLVGKITYDPLPRYQQESAMDVEYYCDFDSDLDVLLRVGGEWWTYTISEYVHVWPGPIHRGDTLRARLMITPLQVGGVRPEFAVIEQSRYAFPDSVAELQIPRAHLRGHFMLGADGRVLGMNSVATNEEYATFLGPLPEVMAESLIFWRDPKPPAEICKPDEHPDLRYKYFAIKMIVSTQLNDSGYRHIRLETVPYHNYPQGITFRLSHSDGVEIKNRSPNIDGMLREHDTAVFDFDAKIGAKGIARLAAFAETKNPDYDNPDGEIWHLPEVLRNGITLYFGIDSSKGQVFITDQSIISMRDTETPEGRIRQSERLSKQREYDSRVAWFEEAIGKYNTRLEQQREDIRRHIRR